MLKKIIAITCCCLLVFSYSSPVFAVDNNVHEGGYYEEETEVNRPKDLWGAKNKDRGPTPAPPSGSDGSDDSSNSESETALRVETIIELIGENETPTERTSVKERTLYWG